MFYFRIPSIKYFCYIPNRPRQILKSNTEDSLKDSGSNTVRGSFLFEWMVERDYRTFSKNHREFIHCQYAWTWKLLKIIPWESIVILVDRNIIH